jgi:hypothetical protein
MNRQACALQVTVEGETVADEGNVRVEDGRHQGAVGRLRNGLNAEAGKLHFVSVVGVINLSKILQYFLDCS